MMTNKPNFMFSVSDKIAEVSSPDNYMYYIVTDIIYSVKLNDWFYEYSYWRDGYEHHCKSSQDYTESNFRLVS